MGQSGTVKWNSVGAQWNSKMQQCNGTVQQSWWTIVVEQCGGKV